MQFFIYGDSSVFFGCRVPLVDEHLVLLLYCLYAGKFIVHKSSEDIVPMSVVVLVKFLSGKLIPLSTLIWLKNMDPHSGTLFFLMVLVLWKLIWIKSSFLLYFYYNWRDGPIILSTEMSFVTIYESLSLYLIDSLMLLFSISILHIYWEQWVSTCILLLLSSTKLQMLLESTASGLLDPGIRFFFCVREITLSESLFFWWQDYEERGLKVRGFILLLLLCVIILNGCRQSKSFTTSTSRTSILAWYW